MANESIVTIRAMRKDIGPVKKSSAFDPRTGRILIAKRAPTAQLEKTGAGVIIDSNGLIVTNLHIVTFADKVAVILHDNTVVGAKILRYLSEDDLALLKIDPPYPLKSILLADSDKVQLGDPVMNIGHSDILNKTISGGIVNRLGTIDDNDNKKVEYIQVNMNLYKGDSGGPLLTPDGHLIGMIAAKYRSKNRATIAIPSNKIRELFLSP